MQMQSMVKIISTREVVEYVCVCMCVRMRACECVCVCVRAAAAAAAESTRWCGLRVVAWV